MKRDFYKDFVIDIYEDTSSTNDLMFELASNNQINHNHVIVAKKQNNGHGRYGRNWVSNEGNLYFSLLIKPQDKKNLNSLLSFVSCVALSQAIIDISQPTLNIKHKWPNDVLINDKKVAGILLKNKNINNQSDFIIIGIGVNINSNPDNTEFKSTNLKTENININPEELLRKFLDNFNKIYNNFIDFGFSSIRNLWLKRAYKINEEITANLVDEKITGTFKNLDNAGNLILQGDNNRVRIISCAQIF